MSEHRTIEPVASSSCPYCGVDTPHQHYVDRKGYVRDFMDPNVILCRIPPDTRPRNAFGDPINSLRYDQLVEELKWYGP